MQRVITLITIFALLFITFASLYAPRAEVGMTGYTIAAFEKNFDGSEYVAVKKNIPLKASNE